jgi:hypothetical protein
MNAYQVTYPKKSTKRQAYPLQQYAYVMAKNITEAAAKLAKAKIEPSAITVLKGYRVIV